MKILAMDLSSSQGSVAWLGDDGQTFVRDFANNRKHSGLFFENLQCCWRSFGVPDAIVVGLGPGSYAGTRIAIATADGLRAGSAAKLMGIPSLCAIETAALEYCVIGDARRESFFFGRVVNGRLVEGPSLHNLEELETKVMEKGRQIFCCEPLPQFPSAVVEYPSARRLAELARDQIGEIGRTELLEPIYLRGPHITVAKSFP